MVGCFLCLFLHFISPDLFPPLPQSTLQLLHAPVQKIKLLLRPPSKAAFSLGLLEDAAALPLMTAIAIFIIFFFFSPIVKPSFVAAVSFYLWKLKRYRLRFFQKGP